MKIEKFFTLGGVSISNTGGNCLVAEIPVFFGGDLKLVTINDDCIVGWTTEEAIYDTLPENELFVTDDWLKLCEIVGCGKAVRIYTAFKDRWHDDCGIKNEKKLKAVQRLLELTDAASLLSELWDNDLLDDGYPFEQSFDDISLDIFNWMYKVTWKLEQPTAEKQMKEFYGNDNTGGNE